MVAGMLSMSSFFLLRKLLYSQPLWARPYMLEMNWHGAFFNILSFTSKQ